jgi:hypothetical protein
MQHALSILTVSAERAENEAIRREQTAACCERDGEFERAENYRAQAAIDRRITDDCREAIDVLTAHIDLTP